MRKIILDCDPGMDDSMAIIMAAKSKEIELMAVTTVNGNYPVEVTSVNARKALELIGRTDIPVAKGLAGPLFREVPKDPFTHGKDGQAEAFLPEPRMKLDQRDAVDLIIDIVKAHPGEVTIVSTAPMTNIALAMLKCPEIKAMIPEIVAISGAFGLNKYAFLNATGDTPQSEWNVYVDPEAADLVYRSGVKLVALGLDVATHFDVNLEEPDMEKLAESDRKEAAFLLNAIRFVNSKGHAAYCTVIDCMAVAYVIDPSVVETMEAHVGVETKNGLTLGMTVIDRRHHHVWNQLPVIQIGSRADGKKFLEMLMELVLQ